MLLFHIFLVIRYQETSVIPPQVVTDNRVTTNFPNEAKKVE